MKKVIQLDEKGYVLGFTVAEESPLEPGVFLIPRNAVDEELPNAPDGTRAKWDNGWEFEPIPVPEPEPEPEPLTYAQLRISEYPPMEDYLDGIVKDDKAQIQAYIDACLAVKKKYPKP